MLTEMRHRVVAMRMVKLSGSFSACKEIAKECNVALMKEKKLSQKYIEVSEEADRRLEATEM